MPEFAKGSPVGLVVWARLASFPWWPGVVVNREEHEKTVDLDPGEKLPAAAETNRMVEFFNDNRRVSVVKFKDMIEYSSNIYKVNRAGKHFSDVIIACEEANDYIATKGLPVQRQSLHDAAFELPKTEPVNAAPPVESTPPPVEPTPPPGEPESPKTNSNGVEQDVTLEEDVTPVPTLPKQSSGSESQEQVIEDVQVPVVNLSDEDVQPSAIADSQQEGGQVPVAKPSDQEDQRSPTADSPEEGGRAPLPMPIRQSRRRSRPAAFKTGDPFRAKRLRGAMLRENTPVESANGEILPDAPVPSAARAETAVNGVVNSALSSFCVANAVSDIPKDDVRLEEEVTLSIAVDGEGQRRILSEKSLPLKALVAQLASKKPEPTGPTTFQRYRRLWKKQ